MIQERLAASSAGLENVPGTAEDIRRAQLQTLMGSVVRHDLFADDLSDEFQVTRENGEVQGIFKVWAPHVLPQLDYPHCEPHDATRLWEREMSQKPLSLQQSLEQWRAFSEVSDRRLQDIFARRPLPDDPAAAVAELFLQMDTAFGFAAPFYNLEALIVDPRETKTGNPIDLTEKHIRGGTLDVVALALPSALESHLTADIGSWNGLNWETISARIDALQEDFLQADPEAAKTHDYALISRIANLAHVDPEDVLFAANTLQFIPADVGGRKGDLPAQDAKRMLLDALDEQPQVTTGLIAKNTNALIRFLNWCPVIRSEENFEGRFWSYGAACDTAAALADYVSQNPDAILDAEFAPTYSNSLSEQLSSLDAASAKGRFLLQLFDEGKFSDKVNEALKARADEFHANVAQELKDFAGKEAVLPLRWKTSAFMVGGKAEGIRRAMHIFGKEKVADGCVISTEAISNWLNDIPEMSRLLISLEMSKDVDSKIEIGHTIQQMIAEHQEVIPGSRQLEDTFSAADSIVLRSSSYDEDVDIIGPAPGVYESVVGIDPRDADALQAAIKAVISSFFSDKAISFRELKGLRHKPFIAVIAQECLAGRGGSVFVKNGQVRLNIAGSAEKINDVSNGHLVEAYELKTSDEAIPKSEYVSDEAMREIVNLAAKAEAVMGPSDMEFALDSDGTLKILQLRGLEHPSKKTAHENQPIVMSNVEIRDLANLPDLDGTTHANLIVDECIDLERFQGALFRWIMHNASTVNAITVPHEVPATCHFANIVESLGIELLVASN